MKTKITLIFILLMQVNILFAQTNLCLSTANIGSQNSGNFWARGGNNGGGNMFGTLQNFDIDIITNGTQRMIINGVKAPTIQSVPFVNTTGFVGIGSNAAGPNSPWDCAANRTGPYSLLHLQGPNNTLFPGPGAGWRTWMRTGTYTAENSDAMYVGLKNEFSGPPTVGGHSDAVIMFSDDAGGPTGGPDVLRFIFTGPTTGNGNCTNCPLNPLGLEGMEIARMTAENNYGRMGIGPLFNAATPPARRLHVDDGVTGNAQLRTSFTLNANPALGIWSDFQTTSLGDMYFNTRNQGNARRFGFHDNTPGNTVEITAGNGSSPIPVGPNGTSGLRFTDIQVPSGVST